MLQKKLYWLCGVRTPIAVRLFGYDVTTKLWTCLSVKIPDYIDNPEQLYDWVYNTLRKQLFDSLIKGTSSFIRTYLNDVNMFDDSDEFNSFIETVNAITKYVGNE